MRHITTRKTRLILSGLVVAVAVSCAARGPRATAQVGALVVGEAVLGFDQVERQLYQGGIYDKATHDKLGAVVLKTLYAARAYERAAAGWIEGQPAPATVDAARTGLLAALTDLEQVIPQVAVAREPLMRALAAIRAALAAQTADLALQRLVLAQTIPVGSLPAFLALLNILGALITSGRTTFQRIRDFLQREGATAEELAAMDARLTTAIEEREAEHAGGPES